MRTSTAPRNAGDRCRVETTEQHQSVRRELLPHRADDAFVVAEVLGTINYAAMRAAELPNDLLQVISGRLELGQQPVRVDRIRHVLGWMSEQTGGLVQLDRNLDLTVLLIHSHQRLFRLTDLQSPGLTNQRICGVRPPRSPGGRPREQVGGRRQHG